MKHVLIKALDHIMRRISNCSKGVQLAQDDFSLFYWNKQLMVANNTKAYIENRLEVKQYSNNVIHVDFKNRKRVA